MAFLIPAPADYLRIWLAQALFQNLTLDLSKLLAVRNLLHPTVITAARAEASREGWCSDFDKRTGCCGWRHRAAWTEDSLSSCRFRCPCADSWG